MTVHAAPSPVPSPSVPPPGRAHGPRVLVVGGGLAGIAAAVRLAQAGVAVTVVETRKRLGGRATSFVDPATGQVLDNCQHVLMRCCTNLLDLYERLGVADQIDWHRTFYMADAKGNIDRLQGDPLPAPLHMTRSLWRFKSLSLSEKIAISRAMLAMLRLGARGRARWHERSFAEWLAQQRQPASVIEKYWAPIVISALNEQPERMAADYALQVFQEGFLANAQAYEMGLSRLPLVELYDQAEQVIERAGGEVLLSSGAEGFEFEDGRVTALRLTDGRVLEADAFVSTVPFDRLAKLSSDAMRERDPRLAGLGEIEVSPIIGIHLWFDRPVMDLPHLALTQSPLQWLFNKGVENAPGSDELGGTVACDRGVQGTGAEDTGASTRATLDQVQHLHGVISAAHDLVATPADEIIAMAMREMHTVLPALRRGEPAALLHGRVVKEKRATFSLRPGIDRLRPAARGAIANLYVAGDWAASGWPATMEGAARSGYLAAAAALEDLERSSGSALVPDLRGGRLYRLLAG